MATGNGWLKYEGVKERGGEGAEGREERRGGRKGEEGGEGQIEKRRKR